LTGTQATLAAGEISCAAAGGNWSAPGTWSGGVLPAATDNVTIADGCAVTIDTSATVHRLTVGQGTSGVLEFEAAAARTLTVNGSVVIAPGGQLRSATSGTVTNHLLSVGVDLTNDGTLDLSTNGGAAGAELRFAGSGDSTLAGGGATTDLRVLSLFKGSIGDVVEIALPFTVRGAVANDTNGFVSTAPYSGTLEISGSATYASNLFPTASYTIPSTGGLWLNNPNFTVNGQNGSATLTGRLRVSDGTFNIGTSSGNSLAMNSLSRVTIEGGTIVVAGRFGVSSPAFTVTYGQSGGTVIVATAGNSSTTLASFDLGTSSGTSFTMSGGTIAVRLASTAATGPRDYRAGAGTYVLTGGTLQFGDASSGAAKTFTMAAPSSSASTVFPDLVVTNISADHALQVVTGPVHGSSVTLQSGTILTLNGFVFDLFGDLTNHGTLTATVAGSRLSFGGTSAQTWSGGGGVTVPLDGLIVDNPAGVTLAAAPFTTLRANLLRGTLTGSDAITLGSGGATSAITQIGGGAANLTSPGGGYDLAPVFNAGTGGVQVLYQQESVARTTGVEIPSSRSIAALTINNANGVTLAGGGLTVGTAFTLTAGLLHTTPTHLLTLGPGVSSPPGGSATTYVEGPLALRVNSAVNVTGRTFGIGSATAWRPVVLSSFHSNGTLQTYTAEVIEGDAGGTPDPPLTSLNPARYFRIQNTANLFSTTTATVQLSYGAGDTVPSVVAARVAQSATPGGFYASRGGGATGTPTTGIVSDTTIQQGDEYFVIADSTPPAPPPNDDCSAAEAIPGAGPFPYLTSTIDVAAATTTGDPALCAATSHTAWYTFTPAATATYTITSCQQSAPGTTATDTVLGVFTAGSCAGPFTTIACNDNDSACAGGTGRSSVTVVLNAGTTYRVAVGTAGAGTPSPSKIQLAVQQLVPPDNNSCAAPVALSLNTPVDGSTVGGLDDYQLSGAGCFTSQGQLGNSASTAAGKDVVYSFTAPAAGKYSIRITNYTGGNGVLYTSSSCPSSTFPTPVTVSTCISAANRTSTPAEEVMCQSMSSGQTVYAVVDETAPAGGTFTVEVTSCSQESEPNNTPVTADPLSCGTAGSISETDVDHFTLGAPGAGWRAFAMIDDIASGLTDTQLRITDTANVWEFDDDDGDVAFGASGVASVVAGGVLPAGATYLGVRGFGPTTAVEPYRLYSVVQPPIANAAAETEPNDVPASADSFGGNYFKGAVSSGTDTDVYSFSAQAGDLVFLGMDCDADRDGTAVNGTLALLATDGAGVLLTVNGSGTTQTPAPSPGTGLTASTPAFSGEGLVYRIRTAGTYYAKITGVPGGSAASQDYALSISTNCAIPPADLEVSQSADIDPVTTGTLVTYTVTLVNGGPNSAYNARLTDNVPAGMTFVSVTPPAGWSCPAPVGGQYTCTAVGLAPTTPATFTIVYRANYCAGNVSTSHIVTASSDVTDPAMGNNTSSLATNIVDPGLCNDGNACTTGDVCAVGICVGGPPPSCDDSDACTVDSCDTGSGCVHDAAAANGFACGDSSDTSCDNPDTCLGGACQPNHEASGVACMDGDACTTTDGCDGTGLCLGGPPPSCDDGNACTVDSCDTGSGCVHDAAAADGFACGDPSDTGCDGPDTCLSGACQPNYEASGMACDDGSVCTTPDACDGSGSCAGVPALSCDDVNPCTDDACDPVSGCVYTPDDTNSCLDGNACNGGETCSSGTCQAGTPLSCDDGNGCTDDACNPATGCAYTNNTDSCDDGSVCTTDDRCGPRFSEDFDGLTPPAIPLGWTTALVTGLGGDIAFETVATSSDTPPHAAWTDAPDHVTDKVLDSEPIVVTTAAARLSFLHSYDLEGGFDGAVLEISVAGGEFTDIVSAGGSFAAGGYDGTLSLDDGSPIAGRSAWTGTSAGFVTTAVHLPASAAGQVVVLRWRVATDAMAGQAGYWLDSIEVTEPGNAYSCSGTAVVCDDSNLCTVDSCDTESGCVSSPGNAGTECRPSSGVLCDPAELCDGVSATCPTDSFGQSSALGNTVAVSYSAGTGTATITWIAETTAGPFNVYRGSHSSSGSWVYNHTCLASGVTGTSATDVTALSPGDLSYYLVSRSTPPCSESSLGLSSSGAERPNTGPCP
jgi:uncharacterized repeat protein (TIGR01451 family)